MAGSLYVMINSFYCLGFSCKVWASNRTIQKVNWTAPFWNTKLDFAIKYRKNTNEKWLYVFNKICAPKWKSLYLVLGLANDACFSKEKNKFPFILALNLSVRCSEFFFSHFHLCNRFANFSKLQIQNAAFLPSNALTPIDILNAKTKKTMMMKKRNLYAVVDLMVSLLLFSVYFIFFLFCVHIQTLIA